MAAPVPKPGPRPVMTSGRVAQLWRGRSCGFIRAHDGQTVFFHARDLERVKYNDVTLSLAVAFELIDDVVSGPRAARIRVTDAVKPASAKARALKPALVDPASAPR